MGAAHGSSCEAVNDCSTPIAFATNTGSTPGASKTSQPQRCGLISISVIASGQRLAAAIDDEHDAVIAVWLHGLRQNEGEE
jgi:hypothetical protein